MLSRLKRTLLGENEQKRTPTNESEQASKQNERIQAAPKTKRTHYTQTEIETIRGLVDEGYSTREIATKTNRTLSGIRNLRRRLDLISKTEKRLPTLREQEKDLEISIQELNKAV